MVRIAPLARLALALIAFLLLVPVIGIGWQPDATLEKFHNRTLAPWPAATLADPPAYFRQARTWLADRAWPIAAAVGLQKRILYFVLATPPAHKLTIGLEGQLFLNGWNETETGVLLDSLCLRAHGEAARAGLARALPQIAEYAARRGTPIDVIIVPTTATLYAQRLPTSVPQALRDGCNAVAAGRTTLRDVVAPPGMHFLYPYDVLRPHLDDPAFYPRNHWHASGKSLVLLRDTWLAAIGSTPVIDERVEPTLEPAEILQMSGVIDPQPAYAVHNSHVRRDNERDAAFRTAIADLFTKPAFTTNAYVNDRPPLDASLLILSDSFGQLASEVFAGAFADVVQVTTNDMTFAGAAEVIRRAGAQHRIDRIVLLFQEGSVDRVINYGHVLQRVAAKLPPH